MDKTEYKQRLSALRAEFREKYRALREEYQRDPYRSPEEAQRRAAYIAARNITRRANDLVRRWRYDPDYRERFATNSVRGKLSSQSTQDRAVRIRACERAPEFHYSENAETDIWQVTYQDLSDIADLL